MKFSKKEIKINQHHFIVYEAIEVPQNIWFVDPISTTRSVVGSSEGFVFLSTFLMIVGNHQEKNSLFHVPCSPTAPEKLTEWWPIGRFDLDLVCFKYTQTQINSKLIKQVIERASSVRGEQQELDVPQEIWEREREKSDQSKIPLKRSLTSKTHSKYLTVAADKEVFFHLGLMIEDYGEIEDSEEYIGYHRHADWLGTAEDNGLDFEYFYQDEEYDR